MMAESIRLNERGVRLFSCALYNHDYLWFSSYEISKLSATFPVIHNYALSYSMSDYSYGVYPYSAPPQYEEDLKKMRLYATPAISEDYSTTRTTYNALNSRTLCTDFPNLKGINTPNLGRRRYINPVFAQENRRERSGFRCFIFTFDGRAPKGVTRLGKKGAAMRVVSEELKEPYALLRMERTKPTHPVNPLDITGRIAAYDPIIIPPHLILRTVEIEEDWFVFNGSHRIHIPRRIVERK